MIARKTTTTFRRSVMIMILAALSSSSLSSQAKSANPPTVESVLRQMADYFKNLQSFSVEIDRDQRVGSNTLKSTLTIAIERPNKIAIRNKGADFPIELVSDGKSLSVSITPAKKYIQTKAPSALFDTDDDAIPQGILVSLLQGTMVTELTSAAPYKNLMEGVKTSAYVGEELQGGAQAHHVKFTQDQFDWEIWVTSQGDPLVRKVTVDMTKSVANTPAAKQLKGQKLEMVQTFKNWKINTKLDESTFAFKPPAGSQKADSFMEAITGGRAPQEPPSPLVGKPAPPVNLKLLDKGELLLGDHRDKHILMLDFWATWCGPCVQELPKLVKIADAYKSKDVAFFAINLRETPEQIKKFQDEKKLQFPVALDPDGSVGTAYDAKAIPLLVLIDKKGVVQSVHVGYNPSIEKTLAQELDDLLAGKNLASEAAARAKADAPKSDGLVRLWTISGSYMNVAFTPRGREIYAIQATGRCDVLDSSGSIARSFPLQVANRGVTLRPAHFAKRAEGFLAFGAWGHELTALEHDGTKLWENTDGQGIDDVCAADLDGDGTDEVIVGYNGKTGLYVFSSDGKVRWKRTDIGNVWNVTAADLDGDGKLEVVSTSSQGAVHVFAAADGKPLQTFKPGIYANKIRVARGKAKPPSKGDLLIVAGTDADGTSTSLAALAGHGKVLWTTKIPGQNVASQSLDISPDGTRAALALQRGQVFVIDIDTHQLVAQLANQGFIPAIAWATRAADTENLLLVATGLSINLFQQKPHAPAPGN